jgi:hypothetical protein
MFHQAVQASGAMRQSIGCKEAALIPAGRNRSTSPVRLCDLAHGSFMPSRVFSPSCIPPLGLSHDPPSGPLPQRPFSLFAHSLALAPCISALQRPTITCEHGCFF